MRKSWALLFALTLLVFLGVSWCGAYQPGPIPSFYTQVDFLLTTPGTSGSTLGGFINPAVYALLPGFEHQLMWSDEGATLSSLRRWGLFLGVPHLGFGFVHQRENLPLRRGLTERVSITDYRIALAAGDGATSFGLGYSWSKGDVDAYPRDDVLQVGMVQRPIPHLSLGLVTNFALGSSHRTGVLDLAARPLGTPILTLFTDAELAEKDRLQDARWGIGAAVQPWPGIELAGKYRDDETFLVGFRFSFGRMAVSATPHYNGGGELSHTTYCVRGGYPEANIFDRYLKKDTRYLSLKLKGRVSYRRYRYFDEGTHTLRGLLDALEGTIDDPRIAGVTLNLSGTAISRVLAWEIRQKLQQVRAAGKKVIVFLDQGGMTEYHLASVADCVVMDPEGYLLLPGYLSGHTFYRGTLEKLGLGVDVLRFYKYKSAGEMFSRNDMSPADREQRQALVDDRYQLVREEIVASRKVSREQYDSWIDQELLFYPQKALDLGLVDTLGRWIDAEDMVTSLEGQKKKMVGPGRLAAREFPSQTWGSRPRIAVVYGLGFCAMDWGIKARQLEKIFRQLEKDGRVKAVVFRVDSPGGEGMASDVVAEALKKCAQRKSVIVSQGSVAASGGYHLSMYADTIVAAPNTVTGSIGVLGGWVWNKGLGSKLGMATDHVKVGQHADTGFGIMLPFLGLSLPDRPLTEEERTRFEEYIRDAYRLFVAKVAQGRGMTEEQVDAVAQGRVWSGVDGQEVGLVDEIGGLELAIALAKGAAGIDPQKDVEIVEMPEKGLFKLDLFKPGIMSLNLEEDPLWQYLKLFSEHPGQPLPVLPPEMYEE